MKKKLNLTIVCPVYYFFFVLTSIFLLTSCEQKPDISNIDVSIKIQRFERDLFSLDSTNLSAAVKQLQQQYPDFFELYVSQIMRFGSLKDTSKKYQQELLTFTQNQDMRNLYDSCMITYPNLEKIQTELTTAFKYFKYYFPNKNIPKLITYISAFGPGAITYDTTLVGINLDLYMGQEFSLYTALNYPYYLLRRFEPEYILPNVFKVYGRELFPPNDNAKTRLIDQMVYEGKLLYFLDKVLLTTPDSLKIGYKESQLDWCKKNEPLIWAYFLENELLYNSESRIYAKYINEAPTTTGMPPKSPGRVGIWMGWQIVRKFMEENPAISLAQLMKIKDGQKILKQAKYKPSKRAF